MEVKIEGNGKSENRFYFENENGSTIAEVRFHKSNSGSSELFFCIESFKAFSTSFGCSEDVENEWVGVTLLKEIIKVAKHHGVEKIYFSRHTFNPTSLFFAFRDMDVEPGDCIIPGQWPSENMYEYEWRRKNIMPSASCVH